MHPRSTIQQPESRTTTGAADESDGLVRKNIRIIINWTGLVARMMQRQYPEHLSDALKSFYGQIKML